MSGITKIGDMTVICSPERFREIMESKTSKTQPEAETMLSLEAKLAIAVSALEEIRDKHPNCDCMHAPEIARTALTRIQKKEEG